ncbi:MAG: ExbD/TolR family protein [Candidatus Loosdrechtia sp.]|uniref:ExbD/TolR family protein n=1 Tax=Candidatus Loosdrechtia sp. TaxID=3101272 RepID=UPI003A70DEF2|nr:MAG: biopolymer transporter ExbD [Candidatus Jettenia sp. AMX2]
MQGNRKTGSDAVAINLAPLIDIVFILLVFFLVTSTFVRDTGIKVDRPVATQTHLLQPKSLRISIAASGALYAEGRELDIMTLGSRVKEFHQKERGSVVVVPDKAVVAGRLIEVIDVIKLAGVQDVAVATSRPDTL